jgi:hypothetical protein
MPNAQAPEVSSAHKKYFQVFFRHLLSLYS